jgi:hypothetical protein
MLASLGLGAGAFLMHEVAGPTRASADTAPLASQPLLVFVYFGGGWDTLASLDPRPHVAPFDSPGSKIYTGYDLLAKADPVTKDLLAAGDGTVQPQGSSLRFGPAVPAELHDHWQDLCVVRGIDMGTLTHEVGRRYFLTGKFPRGLAASGSALPTGVVGQGDPNASTIPNLVVGGVETYNEGFDPKASGLVVNGSGDLELVLKALDPSLAPARAVDDALSGYHAEETCNHRQLAPSGQLAAYRAAYDKARVFMQGELWQHFDFTTKPSADLAKAYDAFAIDYTTNATLKAALAGPKGQALIAAQALTRNICQAVSIRPTPNIDDHDDDWQSDHVPALRGGFEAVGRLIRHLKDTPDPNGAAYWDRVLLVCFSEFARTPDVNARGGRDHHLHSACLVAGRGIRGNTVIGATDDAVYAGQPVDLATGKVDPGGVLLRPADLHATFFEAMGLGHEHISNQDPKIVTAMLKQG